MAVKEQVIQFLVKYGFQILGGLVILACGVVVARIVGKLLQKSLSRFKLEQPVEWLLVRLTKLLIIGLTLVLTVAKMGVDIAPLVAGIGVAGVGIGLAAQGVLSNIFAGFLIIFAKPFRLGEYVEIHGVHGVVHQIGLISTKLMHFDKSIVVIPNRKIVGEILHNYGAIRQLDIGVSVAYDSNLDRVQSIVGQVLDQNARILKDPAPVYGITELGASGINIAVKPWVKIADYITAPAELYVSIINALKNSGIQIPFPQQEVRLLNYSRSADNPLAARQNAGI